jgi:hypothetical protein
MADGKVARRILEAPQPGAPSLLHTVDQPLVLLLECDVVGRGKKGAARARRSRRRTKHNLRENVTWHPALG